MAVRGRRFSVLALLIAAVVLTLAIACALAGCSESKWKNLTHENGRFAYVVDGKTLSLTGIDVSDHNNDIDWWAVSRDGIDFAFVRAGNRGYTEGKLYVDSHFESNFTGARINGLAVGVYIFSQATSEEEAIEEADFVISLLRGRALELPVVFDWESIPEAAARTDDITSKTLTSCALAFCKRIEAAGYQPMVYMNLKDSMRYDVSKLKDYPIWYAQYGVNQPSADFDISVWQYTSSAYVAGIDGATDLDILLLDADKPIIAQK